MKKVMILVSVVFLALGFPAAWGSNVDAESQIAELEARMDQLEKREPAQATHLHHGNGHEGHDHGQVSLNDLEPHAGIDLRYVSPKGGQPNLFLHEVELGLGAKLSKNIQGLVKFSQHSGENMEVHDAYLNFDMDNASLLAGKTRVKFGLENIYCFYSRRTITPSVIGSIIFSEHGWNDTGIVYSSKAIASTVINLGVERGNQEGGVFSTGTAESNSSYPLLLDISSRFGPVKAGASLATGKWDVNSMYDATVIGANAAYSNGPVEIIGEYISAIKQTASANENPNGYYLLGILKPNKQMELLVSFGTGDDGTGSKETRIGLQPTVKLADNVKLRAIYEVRNETPVEVENNRLIVQLACEI